jgi:hypothetical protein
MLAIATNISIATLEFKSNEPKLSPLLSIIK